MNIESSFRDAMRAAGIPTDAPIFADGELHRVYVEGDKPRTVNGWYRLHADGVPAGAFGNWKKSISQTWRAGSTTPLSRNHSAEIEAQRQARANEQERAYSVAADRARKLFNAATFDATMHPYCARKGIQPFDARCNDSGDLVIPVFDARTMQPQSLQIIRADGTKRFLPGGRLSFGCCPVRHSHESFKSALEQRIAIAEGFATAASLARHLGRSVATFSAFTAGNLSNVAIAWRQHYPEAEITIFGDCDENQVGQIAAEKAALAVNGFVAIPPTPGTDWNDLLRCAK